jgi:hypothetical protein
MDQFCRYISIYGVYICRRFKMVNRKHSKMPANRIGANSRKRSPLVNTENQYLIEHPVSQKSSHRYEYWQYVEWYQTWSLVASIKLEALLPVHNGRNRFTALAPGCSNQVPNPGLIIHGQWFGILLFSLLVLTTLDSPQPMLDPPLY